MPHWTGVIAYLDTPAVDGRVLRSPEELATSGLPLPLLELALREAPQHSALGAVESVTVTGSELRAEGTIRDGVLKPGEKLPVGVDLDRVEFESEDGPSPVFVRWRLRGVTAYRGHGAPTWPGAHIRLADD